MKLITLLPTPQHTVDAQITQRSGSQYIAITVWNETKTFRAVSVSDAELNKDECNIGRASNAFFIAEDNGKDALLFIQGVGADRKIVRVDAEIDVLKRLLQTSMNDYPQGKFLFNIDKTRAFYKGYNWLYGLTKRRVDPKVFTIPVFELVEGCPVQSMKETFPILNRAIPARIQKGFFFTENEVYWLDRPSDSIFKLTERFYCDESETPVVEVLAKEEAIEKSTPCAITLPYRNSAKKWVADRNDFDITAILLRDVEEHITIPPATRIVSQNKMTHKTYGQYFIPTQGLYGKEMLNGELVAQMGNRLADDYSIVLRGKGFEMLYTKADVNAIYIRQRGDVSYECDVNPPVKEPTSVVSVQPAPVAEAVIAGTPVLMSEEQYKECRAKIFASIDAALPLTEDPVMDNHNPEIKHVPVVHEIATPATEIDQWFLDVFESPVLYHASNLDIHVTRLAMNRIVVVDLPAPYGQLLAWTDVTHDKNVAALELGDGQLVSFAAATFYAKNGRVFMTETHVRLDTTPVQPEVEPKAPKEALADAVKEALKVMSLAEVLAIVSTSAI